METTISPANPGLMRRQVKHVANPIARGVQFDLQSPVLPVEINLNTLFGCTGLTYRATADTPGIVKFAVDCARGVLHVWPDSNGPQPSTSWVIVHGETSDGVSAVIAFEVRVTGRNGTLR